MNTLIIQHEGQGDPARFKVARVKKSEVRTTPEAAEVVSPHGFPVAGRPDSDLMAELRWYLEQFLGYPFEPETDHAERVQAALREWGARAFSALFGKEQGRDFYSDAVRDGHDRLHLQIASDDPRVLGWPWEALRDPQDNNFLAQTCQIERRLNQPRDPYPLGDLPDDRVNILLVTARPFEHDVRYRSISRPLVELIDRQGLPAQVTVLRPPTFARLVEHLRERPSYYHLVHFDGHGAYGRFDGGGAAPDLRASPHVLLHGPVGHLAFEDDDGELDLKTAERLGHLLREHRIPAAVLNACQSAMVDGRADDPFASVAAALLQAGVRSVVAMAYSVYVSGAQQFLPGFYRRLFESGDVAQATRAGRQAMFAEKGRVCARGKFPLDDWLVPVVYQQDPFDFSFARQAKRDAASAPGLPREASDEEDPYGFVGRDSAILQLERAMRRPPAGVLIQGLGGVGKTTLARGFVRWLRDTDGLGAGGLWLGFQDVRSADYVINRMGEPLFGGDFSSHPMDGKLDALAGALHKNRLVIVWDNFEVVRGIPGTPVAANLSAEDQEVLKTFLGKLRGGATKVIITSRSEEDWLGPTNRSKVGLGGLDGEERWEYCEVILRELGLKVNRKDADLIKLMDLLGGHPLAMRAILPKLEGHTAADVGRSLQSNLADLGEGGDPAQARLFATLRFVEQSIPDDLRPLLVPLALHEQFIDADYLEIMAKDVGPEWTRARIDRFFAILAIAGLLRDRGQSIYEIHPALTGYLRSCRPSSGNEEADLSWRRAFVDFMGRFADHLAARPLHEQSGPFSILEANFHSALGEAERLQMDLHHKALVQSLAAFAQNTRNFKGAEDLLQRLAETRRERGDFQFEAIAYHQLGVIAEERRDLDAAERWYRKSLEIEERHGNEPGAASTYGQLGILAQLKGDLDAAERWLRKSMRVWEKYGDRHNAAKTEQILKSLRQGPSSPTPPGPGEIDHSQGTP